MVTLYTECTLFVRATIYGGWEGGGGVEGMLSPNYLNAITSSRDSEEGNSEKTHNSTLNIATHHK
jgi:hypothetical protein